MVDIFFYQKTSEFFKNKDDKYKILEAVKLSVAANLMFAQSFFLQCYCKDIKKSRNHGVRFLVFSF